jgi:hypothetical protein
MLAICGIGFLFGTNRNAKNSYALWNLYSKHILEYYSEMVVVKLEVEAHQNTVCLSPISPSRICQTSLTSMSKSKLKITPFLLTNQEI